MKRFGAILCLALIFGGFTQPSAKAMSCDNRGSQDRLHFGSNVSGREVRICAEYWWPKSTSKPVISKPSPKTTPAKPKPRFLVVTPEGPIAYSHHDKFLLPGQAFDVGTTAVIHQRSGRLIGRETVVRFTPDQVTWNFGDGRFARAATALHSFRSTGTFRVQAAVRFKVTFRFVGTTNWFADPRPITIYTNQLKFVVSRTLPKPPPGTPYLVGGNCIASKRLGC